MLIKKEYFLKFISIAFACGSTESKDGGRSCNQFEPQPKLSLISRYYL